MSRFARTAAVLTVAGSAALSGCTSSSTPPRALPTVTAPSTGTPTAAPGPQCPMHVAKALPPRNPDGPDNALAWPHPTGGILCRYYPTLGLVGKHVPHGTLYGEAALDAPTAARIVADLDAMPRPQSGERIACPAAFGTHDLLFFTYADHRTLEIDASPDGCPSFTNGHYTSGTFSPAFARYTREVNTLVPPRHQQRKNAAPSPSP